MSSSIWTVNIRYSNKEPFAVPSFSLRYLSTIHSEQPADKLIQQLSLREAVRFELRSGAIRHAVSLSRHDLVSHQCIGSLGILPAAVRFQKSMMIAEYR